MTEDSEHIVRGVWAGGLKRLADVGLATVGLAVTSPVLVAAIVLIKVTSRGSAFFVQTRTGRCGKPFRMYKLRTMTDGRSPNPTEIISVDHPDVTTLGRLLRRTKVDELPQLLNIIRGDMSIIGPRPTLAEQTECYDAFQRQRLLVRPGLTGLAQVHGNTSIPWDERIQYDVYYVHHHGFLMDVAIAMKTLAVIALGERRFCRPFHESRFSTGSPTGSRLEQTNDVRSNGES